MALLHIEEFLSLETGNCEDCKSLKSIFDAARRNQRSGTECLPAYVEQDLLLHCIEHAILHEKKEEAAKYLETFFCVTPANLQYVSRAHLFQAMLCLPMKSRVPALEKALAYVSKALEIAKEVASPENDYLIHNCLVVFWQVTSQFMKPGIHKHLQKWLKSMCHTVETSSTNVQWKILLWPTLLDCCCDSDNNNEANEVWNKIVSHINLFPKPLIRNIIRVHYDELFQERITRMPRVVADDPVLQYLRKVWTHRNSDRSKPSTPPNVYELFSEGPSSKPRSSPTSLSTSEKVEVLTEWFFTALEIDDLSIAKQTLLFMNKLIDRSENPERDLLKLLLKYKETQVLGSETHDRSKLLVNVAKGYRVLQKLIEYNDVKLIQAGSVCLWNICLKCMDSQNRCQLFPTLQLIDKGMKCVGSNLLSLMAGVNMELGCCEVLRANFEAANENFKKAAMLDETGMYLEEIAFQLQSLQLRLNPFIGPLEAEDQAIVSLQIRTKCMGIIRSHLMLAGCALSNDLFCDIVKAEQGFDGFPVKDDWILTYRALPGRITSYYEQMDVHNTDKRFLLWAKLLFIAYDHQWYDIACAAARFCLTSKTATVCTNSLFNGKLKRGTLEEFLLRTLALAHLKYALSQAACIKEECYLLLDIPAILISCDPYREQECEGKWKTYCLPSSILTSLVTTVDIGTCIKDPQFVICAAAHLWNLVVPIIRQKRSIDILGELQAVQRALQNLGTYETDLLLLVYYTHSVVYGISSETHSESTESIESVITNIKSEKKVPPVIKFGTFGKSKPTLTSVTNLAKSAHTQCEEALLTVFERPEFAKYVPWSVLHSLVKTHFRVSVNKPSTTEKMLSNYVKDPVEKKKMQLLTALEANLKLTRLSWSENDDLNVEEIALFLIEGDFQDISSPDVVEVSRVSAIIGCFLAELLIAQNPTNASICIDCVRILLQSAKSAYLLKNDKLLMVSLTRCWNASFPLVLNKWTRIFIRSEMEDCLKLCWKWAQRIEKTMSGKGSIVLVADPFINLACSFLNTLVQILADTNNYALAKDWLEKYLPLLTFGHTTPLTEYLSLVHTLVEGNCGVQRPASWYQDTAHVHTSVEWKTIANSAGQVSDQTHALCNAVKRCEDEKKAKVGSCKSAMPLLELSEFLFLNDCPNKVAALGLASVALSCKALKPMFDRHEVVGVMKIVEEKLNQFCIIVHYALCLERGTQTHKAQCLEAMAILLSIWKYMFQLNGHFKLSDYCSAHVEEWASTKIFLEVFRDCGYLRRHLSFTESAFASVSQCLDAIGEELDWLGFTHFLIPIYSFGKFLVPLLQFDEYQLLQDMKLLDVCLRLKFFTKAAVLHAYIFKSVLTLEQKAKFTQNAARIEEMRRLVDTLQCKSAYEGHICMYDSLEAIDAFQEGSFQQLPVIELLPHLLTEKVSYLVKMGYIGLASNSVQEALQASKATVEKDVDCPEIMMTVMKIIEKQHSPNWKEEVKAVLRKGQELFQALLTKNPQQQSRYRAALFTLEARMMELTLLDIEVNAANIKNYIHILQTSITNGTHYLERGCFLNGLTILTIAMKSILEQVEAKHGLLQQTEIEEMSRTIRHAFSVSDEFLKDPAFRSLISMPTEAHLQSVEIALHFKLCYAQMLLIAGQCVKDRLLICDVKATTESPPVILDYINSLPPWIWKVDDSVDVMAYDECLSIAHSVLQLVPDNSLIKAKCLYVMGQCLWQIARNVKECVAYNAELKKRFLPIVFKNCFGDEDNNTSASNDMTGSEEMTRKHWQFTDAPKLLHLALMGEATEYYNQAFQRSVHAYKSFACKIALSIVDSCLSFDSGVAFYFLAWYQAVQVSAAMKELLLRVFSSCCANQLMSVLCQQDYLESNGFAHSPLWSSFKTMMNSDFPLTSIMNASEFMVDCRKDMPHSINFIVILQHTSDRKTLYGAIAVKGTMKVLKTEGDANVVDELIIRMKTLSCSFLQLVKNYDAQNKVMSDLPQFANFVTQFRKVADRLERYLRPVLSQIQPLLEAGGVSSTQTAPSVTAHVNHPVILLLADKHLMQLPLEAMPFFWRTVMPDCIVRDFSLHLFTMRSSGGDKRATLGGGVAGHKSPGARLSVAGTPKVVVKTVPLLSVDLGKSFYMLEDSGYPNASDAFLEDIRSTFLNAPYRGTKANVFVENTKSLKSTEWSHNEVWQNSMGWICHASEDVGQKLIKEQVRGTSRKMDIRICIMSLYHEEGRKSFKNEFKDSSEIALFLSLAGYSTIVMNHLPQSKLLALQSLNNMVKDIANNPRGIGITVSALNGVGTVPAHQDTTAAKRKVSARRKGSATASPVVQPTFQTDSITRTGSVTNFNFTSEDNILKDFTDRLIQAEAHKEALKVFREKEFYVKFLTGTLVCYGAPNCSFKPAYM